MANKAKNMLDELWIYNPDGEQSLEDLDIQAELKIDDQGPTYTVKVSVHELDGELTLLVDECEQALSCMFSSISDSIH